MQTITTIGLDIAKSVFQVHGIDAEDRVIIRRQLKRPYVLAFFQKLPPCLVGIEACASSHHWSRELQSLGHTVRLMPPAECRVETARLDETSKFVHPVPAANKHEYDARIMSQALAGTEHGVEFVGAAEIARIVDHKLIIEPP